MCFKTDQNICLKRAFEQKQLDKNLVLTLKRLKENKSVTDEIARKISRCFVE